MSSSSSTFCPLPFSKLKINSDGTMSPCCFTGSLLRDQDGRALHVDTTDLRSAWHGTDMRRLRDDVTSDRVNQHCQGCIASEAMGVRSARQDMMDDMHAGRQAFDHIGHGAIRVPSVPRFLYVKYGNTCNLKCSVCGPHSSTRWIEEHNSHGVDFATEHLGYLAEQGITIDRTRLNRWLDGRGSVGSQIRDLLPGLCELTVSGGEPFITEELIDLMQHCVESGHAAHLRLKLLTNGTVDISHHLRDTLSRFAEVYLWYSIDGTGAQFEYQRYPANWEQVRGNVERGLQAWRDCDMRGMVSINCTVSALNVLYLPDYDQGFRDLGFTKVNINVATSGRYEHVDLPCDLRRTILARLRAHDRGASSVWDGRQWESLLQGLDKGSGRESVEPVVDGIRHMDLQRGTSYASCFPEMARLLGLI